MKSFGAWHVSSDMWTSVANKAYGFCIVSFLNSD